MWNVNADRVPAADACFETSSMPRQTFRMSSVSMMNALVSIYSEPDSRKASFSLVYSLVT
jgi:DNA transposition AAA+ family ATPase